MQNMLKSWRTDRDSGDIGSSTLVVMIIAFGAFLGIYLSFSWAGEYAAELKADGQGEQVEQSGDTPTVEAAPLDQPSAESDAVVEAPEASSEAPASEESDAVVEAPEASSEAPAERGGTPWVLIIPVGIILLIFAGIHGHNMVLKNRHTKAELAEKEAARRADREAALKKWQEYEQRHNAIREKAFNAETDWDILFHYPAINDPSEPTTRALYEALNATRNVQITAPASLTVRDNIAAMEYPKAVIALETAWQQAWDHAKLVKQSNLSREERKTIKQIMQLLERVDAGGSTDHEQQVVYDRIEKLIGTLTTITVPERARDALTTKQHRALESGTELTMDDVLTPQGEVRA